MSGAKEIVESIAELFVATAGSASASSIACWRGVRRPNPTFPTGALEQEFLDGAGAKTRVESTVPTGKTLVV